MGIGLGIVGAGAVGGLHADFANRAGTRIAAICDVDGARAAALAATYPGTDSTDRLDELLARGDVDAVVVAVPNADHLAVAIAALDAGKDLLLEKPMAMNVAECDAIIEAKRRSGRIVQMGFVCRYAPAVELVKRCVDEGDLGRIYHAKAMLYRRRGIPGLGRWFTTRSVSGGGVLIDLGVHLIDAAMFLMGGPAPCRVSGVCTGTFGDPIEDYVYNEMWAGPPRPEGVFDVEDGAMGLIRFENGSTLELNVTWAANLPDGSLPNGVVLLGDRGGCILDLWENKITFAAEQHRRLVDWVPQMPPGDAWEAAWCREHVVFAETLARREEPAASVEDGRRVQTILDAMYRSSEEKREVGIE